MAIKRGSLIRLSGPPSRSSGTKELGASREDVMVHREALLIRLFADEHVEGLGQVIAVSADEVVGLWPSD